MSKTSLPPGQRMPYQIAGHAFETGPADPGLHVVATPIGNLEDITIRALKTLAGAELVLCEDSRVTRRLFERYGIRTPLKPYHDHNGERVRPEIISRLKAGQAIGLVSDAGTPLVSDPGFKLVREAVEEGLDVYGLPGPSAPILGLTLSGLPSDRFCFSGFLPQKQGARRAMLEELKTLNATLIFFESAKRVTSALASIVEVLGNRDVVVARELSKLHEELIRGPAADLQSMDRTLKGEVTLLVGPPAEDVPAAAFDADEYLRDALERLPAGKAAAEVSKKTGISRKELYERALQLKRPDG